MEFTDETIICQDCGKEFIFTARDQAFYQEKGFNNKPKRCKECREKKKESRNNKNENQNRDN